MGEEKKVILGSEDGEKLIREYLLGELGDEREMTAIEKQILVDEEFGQALMSREDTLIDDYLDNALPQTERASFERVLSVSADLRDRLRLVAGLKKIAAESVPAAEKTTKAPWYASWRLPTFQFATAGALVV